MDNATVYCPNGHQWYFPAKDERTKDELLDENKALTKRAFQAEHRIEQLEARIRDLKEASVAKGEGEQVQAAVMDDQTDPGADIDPARPHTCDICGKGYTSAGWLAGHMRREHRDEEARR